MAIGSGLGSQVQFGIETTYGTSVTPTVALEAMHGEPPIKKKWPGKG